MIREDIIKNARSWIGTKFRYQGRIKRNKNNYGGVDCLGFIIGVADESGFKYKNKPLSYYDKIFYSKRPDFNLLKIKFSEYFYQKKDTSEIQFGDIILQKLSDSQYHLMIYTGKSINTFIHASVITKNVTEHTMYNLENSIIYSMIED